MVESLAMIKLRATGAMAARRYAIGADSSVELVRICARCARMQSVVADALELPYRDGVFDAGARTGEARGKLHEVLVTRCNLGSYTRS